MAYNEMTFKRTVDELFDFANAHQQLNGWGFGNLVDYGQMEDETTTLYPFLFITPQNIEYGKTYTTYQFTITIGDQVRDDEENRVACISNMQMIGKDLLSYIQQGNLIDYFDFDFPVQATPFVERFNDIIGGVSLDLSLRVVDSLNLCEPIAG